MKVTGWDQDGGGRRTLIVVPDGPLVQFSAEGSEGNAVIMFTPAQMMAMLRKLENVAISATRQTQVEGDDADEEEES